MAKKRKSKPGKRRAAKKERTEIVTPTTRTVLLWLGRLVIEAALRYEVTQYLTWLSAQP